MYHQFNPTELFRERHLALLKEAENRRLSRRLRKDCGPKRRSRAPAILGFLAALAVAGLLLAASGSPAHAETTFVVNSTQDPGDGTCNVNECTFREAIAAANAAAGHDTINFAIPGSGVKTITPDFRLPEITESVEIDGYSQPGASPNTLAVGDDAVIKVALDGSEADSGGAPTEGLAIDKSSDCLIRGLAIYGFSGDGIFVGGSLASGTTIANNNRIEGNFIGTDPSGTQALGNGHAGVEIVAGSFNTVLGGASPSARNLISGNGERGVFVTGTTSGNQVEGNYVGTDKSGTADLGNQLNGITASGSSTNNVIGGATAGAGNLVSGNGGNGVGVEGSGNQVLGNRIGTTAGGTAPLGNDRVGVALVFASDALVGDGTSAGSNTIAFNARDGVEISGSGAVGNSVLSNSIFSNGGLGIDLFGGFQDASGNTANDPGDVDTGPNGLQNKPVLTSARTTRKGTTITGKLSSTPNKSFVVQFYSNASGGNEGQTAIGEASVTTDGSGEASFSFKPARKVGKGRNITATATDTTARNTSEFSAARKVVVRKRR